MKPLNSRNFVVDMTSLVLNDFETANVINREVTYGFVFIFPHLTVKLGTVMDRFTY